MNSNVKGSSKCMFTCQIQEVQSNFFSDVKDNFSEIRNNFFGKPVPNKVLQKHLDDDQHPIFNFVQKNFDRLVAAIKPMYSITGDRIVKNLTGLATSNWQFQLPQDEIQKNIEQQKSFIRMSHYLLNSPNSRIQSRKSLGSSRMQDSMKKSSIDQQNLYKTKYNRSIFMFIWGPITLVILTHLISNHPFNTQQNSNQTIVSQNSNINVIAGGLIDFLLMGIVSFLMFVFFKVFKTDLVHSVFQHMCLSSYVGLGTIIFSLICSSPWNFLIIPSAIVYILGCSYLHINVYNQSIKPQLFQLIGLSAIILVLYSISGYMFYYYYHTGNISSNSPAHQKHFSRDFDSSSNQTIFHQRSYFD